jgi:integrase
VADIKSESPAGLPRNSHERVCRREFRGDDLLQDELRTPAQRRAIHRVLSMQGDVERFLREKDRTLSDAAMARLLDALEREFLPALALLSRRAEGDWSRDARPDKFPTLSEASRPASSLSVPIKLSGLTVWEVFELWIEGRKPAASSVNRWRAVFVSLRERFGQRDAATISGEEAQEWADGLTTPERSAQVVHGVWLRAARTLFAWAVKRRKLASNPFAGTSVPVPKRAPKLREREFNEDEWRTILRATLPPSPPRMEPHNAAARRWVPWLCAYTGSRPGEACQLRAEDVRQHKDGFWTINITPEAGTVKGNVARVVPLHEHLVEQGFIVFAQAKRFGPLFYDPNGRRKADDDPTNPTRQPWVKARDKISEWVRALGVNDTGISPNHAWRHTFKRRAARAGIERRIRFAMCGHSSKEEGDDYETPTIEDLAAEVERFPRYEIAD